MTCTDKYIFLKREVLSKEECKQLIDDFEIEEKQKGPVTEITIRDNTFYYEGITIDPTIQFWTQYLQQSLEEYKKEHTFLGYGDCGCWVVDPVANIQKYKPNQYYKGEHCDQTPMNPNRVLVWMIYLNTINKGGGTTWPQQEFTTKARAGDLYIWPAGWTHSHKGIVAPEEEKYIITGWSSLIG